MSEIQFAHYDTLDWTGIDDTEQGSCCAPSRSDILNAHRCAILDNYLSKIGAGDVSIYETERSALNYGEVNVTRIGVEKSDLPVNYRSPFARLFNKLDKMTLAFFIDNNVENSYGYKGDRITWSNAKWIKESSGLEYEIYGDEIYVFTPQSTPELTRLALSLEGEILEYPIICEETYSQHGYELKLEYWEIEGRDELAIELVKLHSDFYEGTELPKFEIDGVEYDVFPEWDDDKYDTGHTAMLDHSKEHANPESSVTPFLKNVWNVWDNYLVYDEGIFWVEDLCNDFGVSSAGLESVAKEFSKRLALDPTFQLMWDWSIENGSIEILTWLIDELSQISMSYITRKLEDDGVPELAEAGRNLLQAHSYRKIMENNKARDQELLIPLKELEG